MTIIMMIIKTMLMMMMRGAFHRLLATLVPDTHISSGTKSKLWWWWFFVNGEKSVGGGDFEGGQIWYLEVQSQIDSVNILWACYILLKLGESLGCLHSQKKTISSFSDVLQNAKNEDEDNLCCNPKDGRWCLTSGGKMISIHWGVPGSCARRHQGCKGFLQN